MIPSSSAPRTASRNRSTAETTIELSLDIDGSGTSSIDTGVPFFDHMLTLFAKHGLFDLTVKTVGDIEVDSHHTIEDTGIVIGDCMREALGTKEGIRRYGCAYLPMDETLASAALDFSGRPYFVFDGSFQREMIGDMPTELVPHFFRSLCEGGGINLNLTVRGDNDHHKVEAGFKAVARTLRQAIQREGRELPSTKGRL